MGVGAAIVAVAAVLALTSCDGGDETTAASTTALAGTDGGSAHDDTSLTIDAASGGQSVLRITDEDRTQILADPDHAWRITGTPIDWEA